MHAGHNDASYSTHLFPMMPYNNTEHDPDRGGETNHKLDLILLRLDRLDKALEGLVEIILAMPR